MASTFCIQLKALNRKNFIIVKRSWVFFIIEFILPLALTALFGYLSSLSDPVIKPSKSYPEHRFYSDMAYKGVNNDIKTQTEQCNKFTVFGLIGPDPDKIFEDTLRNRVRVVNIAHFADEAAFTKNYTDNLEDYKVFYCGAGSIVQDGNSYKYKSYSHSFNQMGEHFIKDDLEPRFYQAFDYPEYNMIPTITLKLAEEIASRVNPATQFYLGWMPLISRQYVEDLVSNIIGDNFALIVLFMFIFPFISVLAAGLKEKESKCREAMKMMGMKDSAYFMSWMLLYIVQIFIICLEITIVGAFQLFKGSNPLLIFLFLFMYGLSLYGWIVVSFSVFAKVKTGSAGAMILMIGLFYIHFAIPNNSSFLVKLVSCLSPQVCLYHTSKVVWNLQGINNGIQFTNMTDSYQNFTYAAGILMMLFNVVLWMFLGFYLSNVLPSEFGVRKSPFFCLKPSYWCGRRGGQQVEEGFEQLLDEDDDPEMNREGDPNFEPVSENLNMLERESKFLNIKKLSKVYDNGFRAVDGLSLKMYAGQIFALLGHNGAGKTTTISMLTGLFERTSGSAEVFGQDIFDNMDDVRTNLGVCPQHNVLFEQLTPAEHLDIFSDFKGVTMENKQQKIGEMLRQVDLFEQRNLLSKNLSGGQKRKVSVGIALIGDSKLVLMDEPTSGLDPTARRRLWDMLKQNKEDRIIILTTHFMEEADVLGDRIAIMVNGDAQCCGSPIFLKKRFGVGYNLTIDRDILNDGSEMDMDAQFRTDRLTEYVMETIPNAVKMSDISSEVVYQLPNESVNHFSEFFNQLDERKDEFGIKSYGVGVTTLEEVFLKVGEGEMPNSRESIRGTIAKAREAEEEDAPYSLLDESVTGMSLLLNQIWAMFMIKFKQMLRETRVLLIEIIYPSILFCVGIIIATVVMNGIFKTNVVDVNAIKWPEPQNVPYSYNAFYTNKEVVDPVMQKLVSETPLSDMKFVETSSSQADQATVNNFDLALNDSWVQSESMSRYSATFFNNIDQGAKTYDIVQMIDLRGTPSMYIYAEYWATTLLRLATGNEDMSIQLQGESYPASRSVDQSNNITIAMTTILFYSIAIAIICSSIIAWIVMENTDGIKHQQIVSGGSKLAFWVSQCMVDIVKLILVIVGFTVIVNVVDVGVDESWIIMLMSVMATLPFTYVFSFIFTKENAARNVVRILHIFFSGLVGILVAVFMLAFKDKSWPFTIAYFFRLNPAFCFILAFSKKLLYDVDPDKKGTSLFDFDVGGIEMVFIAFDFFLYWFLIYMAEHSFFLNREKHRNVFDQMREDVVLDDDVQAEEDRVVNGNKDEFQIKCTKLHKVYKDRSVIKYAVKGTSFGVSYGECFALLGVNGAGKTTSFKALTGDVYPTSGNVHINGYDMKDRLQFGEARKLIGYCPQFDCIFKGITVYEHLQFYATVKGVVPSMKQDVVEQQLKDMMLTKYRNVHAEKLSGGNKRKLSVAMAMIGNPPIVFLDEPSTGMDPQAKRFMWEIISKISTKRKKSAVVLTTHSMEEADALSTKLGIMVKGQLRCFGTAQHIKNKFGDGYEIVIKIDSATEEDIDCKIRNELRHLGIEVDEEYKVKPSNIQQVLNALEQPNLAYEIGAGKLGHEYVKDFNEDGIPIRNFISWVQLESRGLAVLQEIANHFSHIKLAEHFGHIYTIKIPQLEMSIGQVFNIFENELKPRYHVVEYQLNQASLEQIFNNFAKEEYTEVEQEQRDFYNVAPKQGEFTLAPPKKRNTSVNQKQDNDSN